MNKTATTLDEQIAKLDKRGLKIADEAKAKEILFDIGYYRLGFYWFPFEKGYPRKHKHRQHDFIQGANFDDAVSLYYFDWDLRNVLAPFLHRIEVCFRTTVIYIVSNHYRHDSTWFADPKIVENKFIADLPGFYKDIRKNDAIKYHHHKYRNDIYAPAWKTLEYMTFGNMLYLFQNLKNKGLKQQIADRFKISNLDAFESQMRTVRVIRNICAHGHNLYDVHFPQSIKTGELKGLDAKQRNNISGGLIVMEAILKAISENRRVEFVGKIHSVLSDQRFKAIQPIIKHISMTPAKLPQNQI